MLRDKESIGKYFDTNRLQTYEKEEPKKKRPGRPKKTEEVEGGKEGAKEAVVKKAATVNPAKVLKERMKKMLSEKEAAVRQEEAPEEIVKEIEVEVEKEQGEED